MLFRSLSSLPSSGFKGGKLGVLTALQRFVVISNSQTSLKQLSPSEPPKTMSLLPTIFAVWYPLGFGLRFGSGAGFPCLFDDFDGTGGATSSFAPDEADISFQLTLLLANSETSRRHTSFSARTPSPPPKMYMPFLQRHAVCARLFDGASPPPTNEGFDHR